MPDTLFPVSHFMISIEFLMFLWAPASKTLQRRLESSVGTAARAWIPTWTGQKEAARWCKKPLRLSCWMLMICVAYNGKQTIRYTHIYTQDVLCKNLLLHSTVMWLGDLHNQMQLMHCWTSTVINLCGLLRHIWQGPAAVGGHLS